MEEEKESMYYDDFKKFNEDISLLKRRFPLTFESNILIYVLLKLQDTLIGLNNNLSSILEEVAGTKEEED